MAAFTAAQSPQDPTLGGLTTWSPPQPFHSFPREKEGPRPSLKMRGNLTMAPPPDPITHANLGEHPAPGAGPPRAGRSLAP